MVERPEVLAATKCLHRYNNQRVPAWVDLTNEPWTSKWNTDLAEPARCWFMWRQRELPLQTGLGCLGVGIVDADVPGEGGGNRRASQILRPAP